MSFGIPVFIRVEKCSEFCLRSFCIARSFPDKETLFAIDTKVAYPF